MYLYIFFVMSAHEAVVSGVGSVVGVVVGAGVARTLRQQPWLQYKVNRALMSPSSHSSRDRTVDRGWSEDLRGEGVT